jgi:hypothetical protein
MHMVFSMFEVAPPRFVPGFQGMNDILRFLMEDAALSVREASVYPARVAPRHRRDFFIYSHEACGMSQRTCPAILRKP